MIKASIYRDKNNKIYRYIVKGHADYDEYGKDIVCAAVSVLTQNTLLSLFRLTDIKKQNIRYDIDDDTGLIDVVIKNNYSEDRAQLLLESLVLGIEYIKDSYPNYVTLNDEGV